MFLEESSREAYDWASDQRKWGGRGGIRTPDPLRVMQVQGCVWVRAGDPRVRATRHPETQRLPARAAGPRGRSARTRASPARTDTQTGNALIRVAFAWRFPIWGIPHIILDMENAQVIIEGLTTLALIFVGCVIAAKVWTFLDQNTRSGDR